MVALYHDFFGVPSAQLRRLDTLGRDDTIYRTMHLVFTQVLINRCIVVENLDFHAFVSRIHTHWSTDTYSIVYTFLHETEFETEDEIAICLLGIEVATITIISAHTDSTVHRYIVDSIASPLTHVFAVEQNFKALLRFFG